MSEFGKTLQAEIEFEIEQSYAVQARQCANNAPFIAYPNAQGQWFVLQGCCNSWQCPRCSQIRARHEYAKIVYGADHLSQRGEKLYFVTITCRGKELDLKTADDNYLEWTNRLLSVWRARTKKQKQTWAYVQVTERQSRGAAHSHMIVCSVPDDVKEFHENDLLPNGVITRKDCLYSHWFVKRNVSAGLGHVCDITIVKNPIAVAVYVAKYLFKDMQATIWPKKWRRVRYSQSWPKLPDVKNPLAFPLVRFSDWVKLANIGSTVRALDDASYTMSLATLCTNVLPPVHEDKCAIDEALIQTDQLTTSQF